MAAKAKTKRPAAKKSTARGAKRAPAKKATASKSATARKSPARKAAAPKKATVTKAPAKRASKTAAPKKAPAKRGRGPIRSALKKSDTIDLIAEETKLSKADVRKVLEKREELIERSLKPRGSIGVFQDGRYVKFERYRKKATKKRVGRNLHTGEPIDIPAKRAHNAVKVKKLSRLKSLL